MFQITEEKGLDSLKIRNFDKILVIIVYNNQCLEYLKRFEELLSFYQNQKITFATCEADQNKTFMTEYKITSLPSIVITSNPFVIGTTIVQQQPIEVISTVEEMMPQYEKYFEEEKAFYFKKIEQILNENQVVLFIKGSAQQPMCKFTNKLLELIKPFHFKFGFYDIRVDKPMSFWLKLYSKWPTFPQVFIKKQIIGGGDTIKQLIDENKFRAMIPEDCFFSKLDSLQSQFKYLVLINGPEQENEIILALKQNNIDYQLYNLSIDPELQNEVLKLKGSLQPYLVYQSNIYSAEELKASNIIQ